MASAQRFSRRWDRDFDDWHGRHVVICNWRDSTHPNAGGAELYCERVAERIDELGGRVTLLTARHPGSARSSRTGFGTIRRMGNAFSVYPLALMWLLLHRRDVDAVIDSQNGIPFFSPLVLRRGTPSVLLIHHVHQEQFGLYFPSWLTFVGRLLENQGSALVYGSRAVCVVSPSSRTEVRKKLSFRGPIFVTPCGQDIGLDEARGNRSAEPSVVYVGRVVRQKRLELLIAGFTSVIAEYPNAQLHVIGDGDERERLEQLAADTGLNDQITFHGRVPDLRRDELLSSAWLFVTPSRAEGWGMSVMEAATLGVPALSFRVAGLQDAIEEGATGWLVDEGADLGPAISAALSELAVPAFAEQIASRCQARTKRFTWSTTADRLLGVLSSERERLLHLVLDRREMADLATVVTYGRSQFSLELFRRLRCQDQVRFESNTVELLLVGTDEDGATGALNRIGFPVGPANTMRVARSIDFIGWDLDVASAKLGALANPEAEREDDPLFQTTGRARGALQGFRQ
jgi:glycosyltransferase involved in cell wall biosynthesis